MISQVLTIPPRRRDRAIVSYLTPTETDALLAVPDRAAWHGRRDHAVGQLEAGLPVLPGVEPSTAPAAVTEVITGAAMSRRHGVSV